MTEANKTGFSVQGPGLEIFNQGRWSHPYDWNMVWQSSVAEVIEPMLKRGVSIDKILRGVKHFQREKIAKAAAELGYEETPFPGEMKPQSGYMSTGPDASQALTTQELFKLFNAGFTGSDLEGINHSNLTAQMKQVLGHYGSTRADRITGA